MTEKISLVLPLVSAVALAGCQTEQPESSQQEPPSNAAPLVWAVNVGGPAYTAVDGTRFEAENSITGGTVGRLDTVKGSQDPLLYRDYREGDIVIARAIPVGVYDLTFHFAEPAPIGSGERVFSVLVNDRPAIEQLDVMLSRDGKVDSALTVTVPGLDIKDGQLNVRFDATVGAPVLSALVVRRKQPMPRLWELEWSDEFDYTGAPDPKRWNIDEWPARVVNDEDQTYTARSENLRVADGRLTIEARKETLGDAQYTSARIHSRDKGDVHYGRIEVRAKLPAGQGTWPAIWMLPSDPFKYATTCKEGDVWQGSSTCDAWPNSGEIDIMEHVGYEMGHVHGTVHTQAYYWAKWEQRKGRILIDDLAQQFHVYALEWSPEEIRILVDDHHYFSYVNEGKGWESWPFDQPFHIILNVAVGGMWGRSGGGIDDSIFPQRMEVDYVRVFRLAADNG